MAKKIKELDKTIITRVKISKISKIGVIGFLLTIGGAIIIQNKSVSKWIPDATMNAVLLAMSVTIYFIALGFVVELLKMRGIESWALGAVVVYLGFLILFSPLFFLAFDIHLEDIWTAGVVLSGGLVILSGVFVEAYDLNERFIRKAGEIIEVIQNAEYRRIPGRIASFIVEIFKVLVHYSVRGIRRIKTTLQRFRSSMSKFIREYVSLLLGAGKRLVLLIYEGARANVYLFVLIGGIGAIIVYQDHFVGLASITLFMAGLLFAYPRRGTLGRYVQATQDRAWNITWQTQNMVQRIRRRKILCEKCGVELKVTERKCPSCEVAPERCQVCGLPITPDKKIFHCPSCSSPFHEPHWQQWQRMGKGCPICKV